MSLTALGGAHRDVDRKLLLTACRHAPSLVLDCGNSADPHSLFLTVPEMTLHSVYVVNAEAIYRFRDALIQVPRWIRRLHIRCLIITTISALFSYNDDRENHEVLEHCWEIMRRISSRIPVAVGIGKEGIHHEFTSKFADKIIVIGGKEMVGTRDSLH